MNWETLPITVCGAKEPRVQVQTLYGRNVEQIGCLICKSKVHV